MKQKLFLLLMLVVALAACTKDDDEYDDYASEAPPTDSVEPKVTNSDNPSQLGNFEGEWILDQQIISQPDTIFVKNEKDLIIVDLKIPGDIPMSKALKAIGMEKETFTTDTKLHSMLGMLQGVSDNKIYYNIGLMIYGNTAGSPSPAIYGRLFYEDDHSERGRNLILLSDSQNVGIYDHETSLWTLKITLIQVYIDEGSEIKIYDLPSPLVLLFVAKKRL